MTLSCLLVVATAPNIAPKNINNTSSTIQSQDNQHNGQYRITNFNQLADDDRTVLHTEDISDYNRNEDYDEPYDEYEEDDYYENKESEIEEPHEGTEKGNKTNTATSVPAIENEDRNKINSSSTEGNTGKINEISKSNGLKWFNKQTPNQSNGEQSKLPKEVINVEKILNLNATNSKGSIPNEAELKDRSNIHARIQNIKENANRLNNEKIIYADEKFLLLKFQLTPLNASDMKVLNDGVEEMDEFERKFNERKSKVDDFEREINDGKSKDMSGLFDSSIFDEDDSFFYEFDDSRQRKHDELTRNNGIRPDSQPPIPYRNQYQNHNGHYPNTYTPHKEYKTERGFWIGNKYYPYHGPNFGKPSHHFGHRHSYDFSDEDFSDFPEDCSDEYDESSEEDEGDTGILYGKPRPDEVPVVGKPGVPAPGTGIVYGNSGPGVAQPGILYGTPGIGGSVGNRTGPGNNTDVVLVVIAAQ